MSRFRLTAVALALVALSVAAAGTSANTQKSAISGNISMIGIWTGPEQKSMQAVINAFQKKFPGVKVKYTSGGDNTPTILSTAVQGGNPPDLAAVGQPGLVKDFATRGALKPISFARATIAKNYSPDWIKLGTVNGKLYGLVFKGANKSTVWYSVPAFKAAGVTSPKTFPELVVAAKTLLASGVPAYSVGGGDGWTLTDLFENIYLRQAGPAKYDLLATHKIKWTDPSVKAALRTMAQILGDTSNVYGGTDGALQTDFATSVANVFSKPAKAAMIIEGDFVPGVGATSPAKPITDYNVFPFPSVGGSAPAVVGGGDTVIMFKDSPAARAFVTYLATPAAATVRAQQGGFSSPNKNVPPSAYKDPLNRATALALARAKTFRFDLSDLQPSAFGGTVGQGLFKLFQDFLKSPSNVDGIASQMEAAAAKAYKK
jgi:alpha-glucoside transport system substrate-binding protein